MRALQKLRSCENRSVGGPFKARKKTVGVRSLIQQGPHFKIWCVSFNYVTLIARIGVPRSWQSASSWSTAVVLRPVRSRGWHTVRQSPRTVDFGVRVTGEFLLEHCSCATSGVGLYTQGPIGRPAPLPREKCKCTGVPRVFRVGILTPASSAPDTSSAAHVRFNEEHRTDLRVFIP